MASADFCPIARWIAPYGADGLVQQNHRKFASKKAADIGIKRLVEQGD